VLFYFALLVTQILAYTAIFHYIYPLLEGKSLTWVEALFFTMETITTVGYGYLLPFRSQITMLFSIVVMITGIFNLFMLVPLMLEPYLKSVINPTPPLKIRRPLHGHVVIVGHTELTRELIENLAIADIDIVFVESDLERAREIEDRASDKAEVIWGNYSNTATWENACIGSARSVIVSQDERTNALVILGIRHMTPAGIIAVVDDLSFERYLKFAGADFVLSPKNSTGKILAQHAVIRAYTDTTFELVGAREQDSHGIEVLKLVNIPILPHSPACGKTLRDIGLLEKYGVHILSYWKGGEFVSEPAGTDVIDSSWMLYALGKEYGIRLAIEAEFAAASKIEARGIIAGFGDVGRATFRELVTAGVTCTVIDKKKYAVSGIVGNAEDEDILRSAQVDEAQVCVVALNDDNVNIFTTLMARNMNCDLTILARANEPASVDKLYRAGADYVALLPAIGGQVIAGLILADQVTVMLDLPDRRKVLQKRMTTPVTIADIEKATGVRVIGIEKTTGSQVLPPPAAFVESGESVVVIGGNMVLRKFLERY
jgi:Trk K+ transport system NAD-binding subunit